MTGIVNWFVKTQDDNHTFFPFNDYDDRQTSEEIRQFCADVLPSAIERWVEEWKLSKAMGGDVCPVKYRTVSSMYKHLMESESYLNKTLDAAVEYVNSQYNEFERQDLEAGLEIIARG